MEPFFGIEQDKIAMNLLLLAYLMLLLSLAKSEHLLFHRDNHMPAVIMVVEE